MATKTGTYICSGCDIGRCINISALESIAGNDFNITVCKQHEALCSDEGLKLIRGDIKGHELDAVVIAACSGRIKSEDFRFGSEILSERINLRELVAWTHPSQDEDTQMLAEDTLRMGLAKVKAIINPTPFMLDDCHNTVLVIGGGVTGLTAAIEGARAGYKIILIEKEEKPGGWALNLYKQIPLNPPYQEPEKPHIHKLIETAGSMDNIEILTSAIIKKISGHPGNFIISLEQEGKDLNLTAGSIVLATGWKPYDANKLTEYQYGSIPDVVTNVEFEEMVKWGNLRKRSDKGPIKNILFIQCAGSRDEKHLPYCSNFCCGTGLKQAGYVRETYPDANVFIIYRDMRTPGHYEEFYKHMQDDDRLFLTKGQVLEIKAKGERQKAKVNETDNLQADEGGEVNYLSRINPGNNGGAYRDQKHNDNGISVTAFSELFNEDIELDVDMVVLATGMTPNNTEELNLNYRMGKGLPELKYEFPDSHFICFPYETRRTGIYAAGSVRAPMDIASSIDDAGGAMLKAIQCIEATKRGESVHPRSGDQSWPDLHMQRCTDCKRCTEECPFGSYDETPSGTPLPNPTRCRRCGICLGACPERIINFSNFSINSISEMIRAVHIPDEFEGKPRILAFVCENDAYPAFDMAGLKRLEYSPYLRIIPVRCIGSVNKIWISDALSQGFDGIMLFGCKPGDDYQCHYIHGSELTQTRGENIQETLDKMMLEPERIKSITLEIDEYNKIPGIIEDYMETIEGIGPNPFKGM